MLLFHFKEMLTNIKKINLLQISTLLAPTQPPAPKTSSATSRSSPNIAVASWGEGIVGTSSHSLNDKGVITSRGVQNEVKSSKEMYPSLKPRTPDSNKNTELYTGFATVTPISTQTDKDLAAITIQRYWNFKVFLAWKLLDKK